MGDVEDQVADILRKWPCSYKNRTQALHQILVVLGNGRDWYDGRPLDRVEDPRTCVEAVHEKFLWDKDMVERMVEAGLDVPKEYTSPECPSEDRRGRAEELALVPGPLNRRVYQASSGALLLTLPDDITDEWRAAAVEIARVVLPLWETPDAEYWSHASPYTENARSDGLAKLKALIDAA